MRILLASISILLLIASFSYSQGNRESDDFSYALKLYEEKFYDLAAQQFVKFSNNHPASAKLDEAGFYAGMSLYNLGDYKNARIEFQSVAVNFPKSNRAAESWFMCGESYEKLENLLEAAKSYETVKTLYASSAKAPTAALKSGNNYLALGNYDKADQLFSLIQDRYIESISYYSSLISHGRLYIEKGKISKAREKLVKVLTSDAADEFKAQANYLLGQLSEEQGYIKDAENYFSIVRKSYGNSKDYINSSLQLAKIKITNGSYNEAKKILNDGLDRNPSNVIRDEMYELLGDANFLDNKFALAQKSYEKSKQNVINEDKNRRILKNALAWYYQKNISNALSSLEFEFDDLPDTIDVYLSLSIELYFNWLKENNEYNKAINKLNELKISPHFTHKYRKLLINILELDNNWPRIIRELEPVIKSGQNITEIDDYVFSLASAYENIGDYEKANYFYNKLLLEFTSSTYVEETKNKIDYISNFYLKNENMGVGKLAILIGDLLNQGDKSKLQFQLGKIYYQNLIDYKSAIDQFENALNIPENSDIKSDILFYIGQSYFKLSQINENSVTQQKEYLSKAKEYFSQAMENINSSSNPDHVAFALVECGIILDNPAEQKQINYYSTLIKNYPQSTLQEEWHNKLANIYYANSNNALAIKEYEILRDVFKSSERYPTYLFLLAKLRQKQSIDDYRIIAGEFPNSPYAAESLFKMAEMYYNNGQFEESGQLYSKLISDYFYTDLSIQAKQNLADTFIATNKYKEAIKFYKTELSKFPINDAVLRNQVSSNLNINSLFKIGKAYYNIADWQNARNNISSYLKLTKDNLFKSEAYLLLGDTYYQFNDFISAIDSYSKVTKDDINSYNIAMYKKGNCQFELKQFNEAAGTFNILLKSKENEEIYAKYIIAQIRSGKRSAAGTSITTFKKKFPKQTNYIASFEFEIGEYLRLNKNYNDALKKFKYVKKNYKNSDYEDDAVYHEALVYITLNKQQEALDILTKFAKTYKNSDKVGAVLNTLGGIYFRSEKYESAILSFKNALNYQLTLDLRKQVLSNLIKTYTYVSFWDAALALSRDYINEYPDADDIIDKKITISQSYVNLNQFDRAVELLRQARTQADSEKEPEIQFYIGEAYLKAGQYENAIAEFVKIPLLSRKTKLQWEASALYYSGQAYEKMGKINEAIRMYEEIVKRPGIDLILKKDAQKRIEQIKS